MNIIKFNTQQFYLAHYVGVAMHPLRPNNGTGLFIFIRLLKYNDAFLIEPRLIYTHKDQINWEKLNLAKSLQPTTFLLMPPHAVVTYATPSQFLDILNKAFPNYTFHFNKCL